MSLPKKHQTDFARRKGSVPYPCFYCLNYTLFLNPICDEHNIVIGFGTEDNVPQTCMACLVAPSDYGDCSHIMVKALPDQYKRWYPSSIFNFFTKEYAMDMLTTIRSHPYLTKSIIIGRAHKGYHTREQRLQEFLDSGLVDVGYNINCEEIYHLTDYGEQIADAISDMLERYILIKQHGELMAHPEAMAMFEYIRENPGCTEKAIYDRFDDDFIFDGKVNYEGKQLASYVLEKLLDAEYVECAYDSDFTNIRYDVTQKGIDRWARMHDRK